MEAIKKPVIKQEWQKHEPKMDNNSITVKVLTNKVSFKPILINTGYNYYSIMDKNLITESRLLRIKIPPKPIINFITENTKEPWVEITKITKFSMNIPAKYIRLYGAYLIKPCNYGVIMDQRG